MAYTLYSSETYWQERAKNWKNIAIPAFFSLSNIQEAWWKSHHKPELRIVEITQKGKVVGVVPFCSFDQRKTLQFLGDQDVSDYLDWIVADSDKAEKGLQQFLAEDKTWQKIELISIPHTSSLPSSLKTIAKQHDWKFSQKEQDVCPIISLPETWEEYLQNIGKKQRHEIQRKWKRLEEQVSVTFRVVNKISRNLTDLEKFIKLHRLSSIEKATFWTDEHLKYFKELTLAASKGGWLRLYFLDINGEPAAAMYCFEYEESLLVYNSGFDATQFLDMSPGQVLTAFTIQDAIKRGKKKYDFLRGNEEYKSRYGTENFPVFNVTVTK